MSAIAAALLLGLWWLVLRAPLRRRRPCRESLPPAVDVWANYQAELVRRGSRFEHCGRRSLRRSA